MTMTCLRVPSATNSVPGSAGPLAPNLVDIVVRPIRNIIYMLLIVQYTAVATPRVVYGSLRTTFWGSFVIQASTRLN